MFGFVFCLILGGVIGVLGGVKSCLGQRGSASRKTNESSHRHFFDSEPETKKKKHTGRCDGDCDNCPPHYGYRYGRWYYGHDHQHGCERGGNKGL